MYPPELVAPMKEDLTSKGYKELTTAEEVDSVLNADGTAFVVLNSVCGCAAANARPAAIMASTNDKLPSQLVTVFAGVDKEAVDQGLDVDLSTFENIHVMLDQELSRAMRMARAAAPSNSEITRKRIIQEVTGRYLRSGNQSEATRFLDYMEQFSR